MGFTWLWFFPQVTLGMTGSLNKQRGKTFEEAQQGNYDVEIISSSIKDDFAYTVWKNNFVEPMNIFNLIV